MRLILSPHRVTSGDTEVPGTYLLEDCTWDANGNQATDPLSVAVL